MAVLDAGTFVQNDTKPDLDIEITDDDNLPIDLSGGAVVRFRFRKKVGDKTIVNIADPTCLIIDGPKGKARYEFKTGELSKPGNYEGEVEITFPGGDVQTADDTVEFFVRPEFC